MLNPKGSGGHEFAFYHSLVDDDPNHANTALLAYGRVAASWSRLENHLDALIIQVNKPQYSKKLYEEHPVSFSRKIKLLKRWFNQYAPLAPFKGDVTYLASRLKLLADGTKEKPLGRNVLLHSIPASFDAETATLTLQNMKHVGDDIHIRNIQMPLTDLTTFCNMVQLSNQFLGLITVQLFTPEWLAKLGKL